MSLPYMPFFVGDYLLDTPDLSFCEHGAYCRLLMLSWITPGGTMPADDEWVRAKLQTSPEVFAEHVKPMLNRFFKTKRGRYVNPRLKAEWDKIQLKIAARKDAGKRGGLSKAQNAKDKAASKTTILPVAKPYHSPDLEVEKKDSEAKASGETAPEPPTIKAQIWAVGRPMFEGAGTTKPAAGTVIGKLIKIKGDIEALAIITRMRADPPADPESYLWKIINGKAAPVVDPGAAPELELVLVDGRAVMQPIPKRAA
jgi:uncharacterized protein YdaU (DUF1376 family)